MSGALTEDGRRVRDQQLSIVACQTCPRVFTVKARRLREITAGRADARCESCRATDPKGGAPAVGQSREPRLLVDDAMRAWWAERFSLAEMVEMATAAWGSPAGWSDGWRDGFLFVGSEARAA